MEAKIINYYSNGIARLEDGKLVQINYHDSGYIMGLHEPIPIEGHIKTRMYLWLAFKGLVGEYSYNDLVKARKAYQSCDGVEVVNGQLPIDEKLFYLGQDIHKDVYESKPIKMYML